MVGLGRVLPGLVEFALQVLLGDLDLAQAYLLITEGESGPPNLRSVTDRHCTLVNVIKTRGVAKAREYCRYVLQESWENTLRKLRELASEPKAP